MKIKIAILLFIFLESCVLAGNISNFFATNKLLISPQIDKFDQLVFDLSNAVMTGNQIDVPVKFLSNDPIESIDFTAYVNKSNLVYDTIITYYPFEGKPNYDTFDSLRFGGFEANLKPFPVNKTIFIIRFHFKTPNPCNVFGKKDINPTAAYLNGLPCSFVVTDPPPFKVPIANFINSPPCLGSKVIFLDTTQLIQDKITSWKWDFANGSTSTQPDPITVFNSIGVYTVTLIVKSSGGCSDTISKLLNINPPPVAFFSYVADCSSGNMIFTDQSTPPISGAIDKWKWDFGDDSISHQSSPIYNYENEGTYTVTLTATSDSGCVSEYKSNVLMNLLCARFKKTDACIGSPAEFFDRSTSTAVSGPITKWKWYFGDADVTSSLHDASYTYPNTGTYTVSLKVSNLNCSDSISKTVTVENYPIVKFTQDKISGCMPLTVNFTDTTITEPGSTHFWDFGDNDTSYVKNAAHVYTINGAYSVKHYVTTPAGCKDSLEKLSFIDVLGAVASFSASSKKATLPATSITFTNRSNSYSDWIWNFGDSLYSTNKNPEHFYSVAGTYLVCLNGKNANGCASNYCDTISILNPNIIAVPDAFTPNGDNMNDVLKVRGGPVKEMELRIFNEWGKQVFISNSQNEGWDGNYNGAAQPVGIYEYSVKGNTDNNETISMHGVVNLIR
jgi:gliding motility-associated-like protein